MLSVQIHGFVQLQADTLRVINQEKSLGKGVWYPVEYLEALQKDLKEKDGPRVQWMKEKEICRLGFVDPKTFDRRDDFTFVAKAHIVASVALKQLKDGLALLECGNVVQLSLWSALHDYLGTEKFDALVGAVLPPLYLQSGAFILKDLYQGVPIKGEKDIQPGDICSFKNIPQYRRKNPNGIAFAWNTICSQIGDSGPKFMGLGLSPAGESSAEIEKVFFNEFNKEPLDPYFYFAKSLAEKLVKSSLTGTLTWEEFQKVHSVDANGVQGRLVLKVLRPRLDRIQQLKNTSIHQLRKLIASWK